jgi:hypothetical protein
VEGLHWGCRALRVRCGGPLVPLWVERKGQILLLSTASETSG